MCKQQGVLSACEVGQQVGGKQLKNPIHGPGEEGEVGSGAGWALCKSHWNVTSSGSFWLRRAPSPLYLMQAQQPRCLGAALCIREVQVRLLEVDMMGRSPRTPVLRRMFNEAAMLSRIQAAIYRLSYLLQKLDGGRGGLKRMSVQEKDPKPVWSGCFTACKPGNAEMEALPDTVNCNSGALWGRGSQLTCCVLLLYKENVSLRYFYHSQSVFKMFSISVSVVVM